MGDRKLDKPGELETMSPSRARTYLGCGVQYRKIYIEGKRVPPGFSMVQGTSLHAGTEAHMLEKIKTGQDPKVELALDAAVEKFRSEMTERAKLVKETGIDPDAANDEDAANDLESKLIQGIKIFHSDAAPSLMPTAAEEWIRLSMGPVNVTLTGRKDLVVQEIIDFDARKLGTRKSIIDFKFTKNKFKPEDAKNSIQLMTYGVGEKAETGQYPANVGLVGITKQKTPQVSTAFAVVTADDEKRLMKLYSHIINGIRKQVFLPALPGAWQCSPKYCGFYSECTERLNSL